MTLTELKKQVEKGYMPSKLVAVNNNQTLFEYYLDNFSIKLNKNIKKLITTKINVPSSFISYTF